MINKKKCFFVILIAMLLYQSIGASSGQTYVTHQDDIDIMFVIDYSNSMNANDSNRIALQMIEACIDNLDTSTTKVGLVAYSDKILYACEPMSIAKKSDRQKLKKKINDIQRSGSTDIGLALKEVMKFIDNTGKRKTNIILISDGEPYLTYSNSGRTIYQSYRDMEAVSKECGDRNIPIHTIAFSDQFHGTTSCLKDLSKKSNGISYKAKKPNDLIDIFGEIIEKNTISKIVPVSISIASNEEQVIELPIKDTHADEVNILVVSEKPLDNATIYYSGKDISYSKSRYYFTCKIKKPMNEDISMKVKGTTKQEIRAYLLLYKHISFELNVEKTISKNVPFTFTYSFYENDTKKPIADEIFYKPFQVEATLKNTKGSILSEGTNEKSDNLMLSKDFIISKTGNYVLKYKFFSNYYSIEQDIKAKVVNDPPTSTLEHNLRYVALNKKQIFDLNQYFLDKNQDSINFEIVDKVGSQIDITIQDNQLIINREKAGETDFIIKAVDAEGAVYEQQIHLVINPIWKQYMGIILGIMTIIGMFIAYMIWNHYKNTQVRHITYEHILEETRKEIEINTTFTGKLNAYFTKLPDEMEIKPLTFALYQIKEKSITLADLLETIDIPLKALDGKNILFKASTDKELILYHNSQSSITVGTSIVCKKIKYSIEYGNKIYITSEDGEYELEIHYVSMRT